MMIQSKKRPPSSEGEKPSVKKPKLAKPASDDGGGEKPVKKFSMRLDAGSKEGKFQKKLSPAGPKEGKFQKKLSAGGKKKFGSKEDFKGTNGEKKPFVENTPEAKREYWNGLKAKQKELREQRRKSKTKDLYELSVGAKKIYETLKRKSTENKEKLVVELHEMLSKDKTYGRIATSHDTARVIQCMIKNASEELRMQIADKLIPVIFELATSKYGHHCVTSLLKNGNKLLWAKITDAVIKHAVKMANQAFSGSIVDAVYNEYATNEQKAFMRQAFYSEIYQQTKDKNVTCMKDTWETNTYMKKTVLSTVKGHLVQAANKQLTDNALMHALLLDFLQEATEIERTEVIELYLPHLAAISSTKDGTAAAIFCFLNSVVKDRRAALKALKPYVGKLSSHEHGHRLVLCILNCYDDTVILGKQFVSVLMEHVETIVGSGEWGRKVIGWIFSPADKDLLHPTQIEILDGYLKYSKKDKEIRRREIFAAAVEPFCKAVTANAGFWLRGGHTALLTAAILKNLEGNHLEKMHRALATVVSDPEWRIHENEVNLEGLPMQEDKKKPDENKKGGKIRKIKKSPFAEEKEKSREKQLAANPLVSGVEHAGMHIALKKIIKMDQEKRQEDENASQFGKTVMDMLSEDTIKSWILQNRTCFLLLLVFENSTETVQKQVKQKLKSAKSELKKQTHAGAKLLLEKLKL
ncbi:protein penguin [Topomyia yanbarensis]|uniref:protein penguin n=1 Tax=Topomyia yanbarensis TaxID=2498891 RepID=UPI00273C2147|nr:protein penguin [Topomyia yanbarensis]